MSDGRRISRARAALFIAWAVLTTVVMGVLFAPAAAASRSAAYWSITLFCRQLFWMMALLCGVRAEARGAIPSGAVIVAAKHQSYLDVLMMMRFLHRPQFVMKRSLVWMPIVGLYALRIGAAPIDRSAGVYALRELEATLEKRADAGQIVIYPEGTRIQPGERGVYRRGVARLARAFAAPCVPAATNSGLFWPKSGMIRQSGVAVIEFLEPLSPPATSADAVRFMTELEERVETASTALLRA